MKQMIVFKNQMNRLLFINKMFLQLTTENAVMEIISLVGDVRRQHVGEVGAQILLVTYTWLADVNASVAKFLCI